MVMVNEDENAQTSTVMINLLRRKLKGQISTEEFQKELAYWSLIQAFDKVAYVCVPQVPQDLLDYWGLSLDRRKKVSREFFEQRHVKSFFINKSEAFAKNREGIDWLEQLIKMLPADDVANREKVNSKLLEMQTKYEHDFRTMKRLEDASSQYEDDNRYR